nr:MAG TPA: hypothetical protein [Caudoviricetes sp.]
MFTLQIFFAAFSLVAYCCLISATVVPSGKGCNITSSVVCFGGRHIETR